MGGKPMSFLDNTRKPEGFGGVTVQQNNRGWLCLTAKKSG